MGIGKAPRSTGCGGQVSQQICKGLSTWWQVKIHSSSRILWPLPLERREHPVGVGAVTCIPWVTWETLAF